MSGVFPTGTLQPVLNQHCQRVHNTLTLLLPQGVMNKCTNGTKLLSYARTLVYPLDGTATRWSSYQQLLDFGVVFFFFLNTHMHSHEQMLMGQTGL